KSNSLFLVVNSLRPLRLRLLFAAFSLAGSMSVLAAGPQDGLPRLEGKIDPSPDPNQPFVRQLGGLPSSERITSLPAPFDKLDKVWTLPELVDEALRRNPATTRDWKLAHAAAADVGTAKSAYAPTVTLGGNGGASHETSPLFPGQERI